MIRKCTIVHPELTKKTIFEIIGIFQKMRLFKIPVKSHVHYDFTFFLPKLRMTSKLRLNAAVIFFTQKTKQRQ